MGREVGAYVCAETPSAVGDSARTWARLPRIRGIGSGALLPEKVGKFYKK